MVTRRAMERTSFGVSLKTSIITRVTDIGQYIHMGIGTKLKDNYDKYFFEIIGENGRTRTVTLMS